MNMVTYYPEDIAQRIFANFRFCRNPNAYVIRWRDDFQVGKRIHVGPGFYRTLYNLSNYPCGTDGVFD